MSETQKLSYFAMGFKAPTGERFAVLSRSEQEAWTAGTPVQVARVVQGKQVEFFDGTLQSRAGTVGDTVIKVPALGTIVGGKYSASLTLNNGSSTDLSWNNVPNDFPGVHLPPRAVQQLRP